MKKAGFLNKLEKIGKLQIIEPSEAIKESYTEKSESNLVSAKILLENNKLEEAVALTYYSMYHMLTALLFRAGIKCENHIGSIMLLHEIFSIDNSEIEKAKKERVDKQYYTDFGIAKEEVGQAIKSAEKSNQKLLDFISKLNNKTIEDYRNKLKLLLKE